MQPQSCLWHNSVLVQHTNVGITSSSYILNAGIAAIGGSTQRTETCIEWEIIGGHHMLYPSRKWTHPKCQWNIMPTSPLPYKKTTTHTHTHTTVRETHHQTPTHSILWSVHFSIGKRKIVPLMMSFLPPCCYTCFYFH